MKLMGVLDGSRVSVPTRIGSVFFGLPTNVDRYLRAG